VLTNCRKGATEKYMCELLETVARGRTLGWHDITILDPPVGKEVFNKLSQLNLQSVQYTATRFALTTYSSYYDSETGDFENKKILEDIYENSNRRIAILVYLEPDGSFYMELALRPNRAQVLAADTSHGNQQNGTPAITREPEYP
jgi:hypothetical protein